MGTAVFPFTMRGAQLDEHYAQILTQTDPLNVAGRGFRRQRGKRLIVQNAELLFPDTPANKSFADWDTFNETTIEGGSDSFLYASVKPVYRIIEGEAAGTAAGGGGETCATLRKFLNASTLVVKVGGVTQTLTTDYTLAGNFTAPTITTTASFDTGTVTFEYEFYFQMFLTVLRTADLVQGASLSSPGTDKLFLQLTEQDSGGSLV